MTLETIKLSTKQQMKRMKRKKRGGGEEEDSVEEEPEDAGDCHHFAAWKLNAQGFMTAFELNEVPSL